MSSDNPIEIVPAILVESVESAQEKVIRVNGKVQRVQIDVIDGIFADNLTISVADLRDIDFLDLKVDVQLMTEYPIDFLGECHTNGVDRVFGQIERMHSQKDFVEKARELNLRVGLAVDLFTPLESLDKNLLFDLDGILLMSVKAGFSGQPFDKSVLDKISQLREMGFEHDIQIDGGMDPSNICLCMEAGANQFAEGSYLWSSQNIDEALKVLCTIE